MSFWAHSHPWHNAWSTVLNSILELMEFSESCLQIYFKKEKLQEPGHSWMSGTNQYSIQTVFECLNFMLLKVLDICCCISILKCKRRGNSIFCSGKWLLMMFTAVAISLFASVDNYLRNHLSYNSLLWKQNQGIYFPNETQNVVPCSLAVKSYREEAIYIRSRLFYQFLLDWTLGNSCTILQEICF